MPSRAASVVALVVTVLLGAAVLVAGLAPSAPWALAKDAADAEAKARAQAAEELAAFASLCASVGARTAGDAAVAEARGLDPDAAGVAAATTELAAVAADADGADAVLAKKRAPLAARVAKAYDRLAALDHDAKETARFEGYLFRAVAWDPSKARIAHVRREIDGAPPEEAGRLLVRLRKIDAEGAAAGRYDAKELELATKGLLLVGSPDHDLVGWLSLPRGWTKGRTYPVLVGVEGAGCGFAGYAHGLANTRGSRPVIVLAPCTLSNTNELLPEKYPWYPRALLEEWAPHRLEFDGPGVDALLRQVRDRFGGEEKVFLTGFSGGGRYTYWKLLRTPDLVRGAAPACANFAGEGAQDAPHPTDGGPPVHLMTGEKDPHRDDVFGQKPGIEGQTDSAQQRLEALGFTRVDRECLPGVGHSSLHAQVWDFVDRVLGSSK